MHRIQRASPWWFWLADGMFSFENSSMRPVRDELNDLERYDGISISSYRARALTSSVYDRQNYSRITFIGHSLGGLKVHELAGRFSHHPDPEMLVVSLDGASFFGRPTPGRDITNPHRWINVYVSQSWPKCDGCRWKFQGKADHNVVVHTNHHNAKTMFLHVQRTVRDFVIFGQ